MRVSNWDRWQKTKATLVAGLFLTAIGLIGGLEGFDTPNTWPLGIVAGYLSLVLFNNVIRHDRRRHPERYR